MGASLRPRGVPGLYSQKFSFQRVLYGKYTRVLILRIFVLCQCFPVVPSFCEWVEWERGHAGVGVDVSRSGEGMSTRERWYAGLVWGVFVPLEFGARVDAWLLCFWRLLVSAPVHEFPKELVALFQQVCFMCR